MEHSTEFRQLVETHVPVLWSISGLDRLLTDADRVTAVLRRLITKFLTTFDLKSAPTSLRPSLEKAAEKLLVYGIFTHCVLFESQYRHSNDGPVDMDSLYSHWIVQSLTASSAIGRYDRDNGKIPSTVFEVVFDSEVEPIQKSLGLGWWRRTRNRSKFHNLFASGIVLGMLYDMALKEVSESTL